MMYSTYVVVQGLMIGCSTYYRQSAETTPLFGACQKKKARVKK